MIWLFLACDGPPVDSSGDVPRELPPVESEPFAPAARADLRMKRWRQISLDLQGALELGPDDVCRETDLYDCFDLHAVPMGGLSRDNGIYDASEGVGVTTGLAVERVVLQACWRRVELDRGEDPVVFDIDLDDDRLSTGDRRDQAATLYQRMLGRDPLDAERDLLVDFHDSVVEDGTNADWAVLSCFVVGTSSEALFY